MSPQGPFPHARILVAWSPTFWVCIGALALVQSSGAAPPKKPDVQKQVNEAVDRGVAYLCELQGENGSWSDNVNKAVAGHSQNHPVGYTALPGLTLLECGKPAADPKVQNAARYVRNRAQKLTSTYDISLAILFLDRLGDAKDRALIRTLALRLAASQTPDGGWNYRCGPLTGVQERKLLEFLRNWKAPDKAPPPGLDAKLKKPFPGMADNSNTQFAILALWVARKHDLPLAYTFSWPSNGFASVSYLTAGHTSAFLPDCLRGQ